MGRAWAATLAIAPPVCTAQKFAWEPQRGAHGVGGCELSVVARLTEVVGVASVLRSIRGREASESMVGAWLSLVERCVRDAEVGGSNPLAPTSFLTAERGATCRKACSFAGVPGRGQLLGRDPAEISNYCITRCLTLVSSGRPSPGH